jgi:AcrR family transcriptional regulator
VQQPEKGRTRLDPEVRRGLIIDAAASVFQGRDPAEVTFEEIAEAAGVSRALVYNYFGDRGGLLAAVYLRSFDTLNDKLRGSIGHGLAPVDRVRETVRVYLRFARDNPAGWRLLQLAGAMDHPAVLEARQRRMDELATLLGGAKEARTVACGIVGMLEAATLDWLHGSEVEVDHLTDVLFDLLWTGLSSLATYGISMTPAHAPLIAGT